MLFLGTRQTSLISVFKNSSPYSPLSAPTSPPPRMASFNISERFPDLVETRPTSSSKCTLIIITVVLVLCATISMIRNLNKKQFSYGLRLLFPNFEFFSALFFSCFYEPFFQFAICNLKNFWVCKFLFPFFFSQKPFSHLICVFFFEIFWCKFTKMLLYESFNRTSFSFWKLRIC